MSTVTIPKTKLTKAELLITHTTQSRRILKGAGLTLKIKSRKEIADATVLKDLIDAKDDAKDDLDEARDNLRDDPTADNAVALNHAVVLYDKAVTTLRDARKKTPQAKKNALDSRSKKANGFFLLREASEFLAEKVEPVDLSYMVYEGQNPAVEIADYEAEIEARKKSIFNLGYIDI